MSFKIFVFYIVFTSLYSITEASLFFDSATPGETFNFDFGAKTKSLQIVRNGVEEILNANSQGTHHNVKLSSVGILTISPVTENDFGMYISMIEKKNKVGDIVFGVAPSTLQLTRKE